MNNSFIYKAGACALALCLALPLTATNLNAAPPAGAERGTDDSAAGQAPDVRRVAVVQKNPRTVKMTDGTVLFETTSGSFISGDPQGLEREADGVIIKKHADGSISGTGFTVMESNPGMIVRVNNDGTVSTFRTIDIIETPGGSQGNVLYEETSGNLELEEEAQAHFIRPVQASSNRPQTRQAWGDNAIIPANYMQDPSKY